MPQNMHEEVRQQQVLPSGNGIVWHPCDPDLLNYSQGRRTCTMVDSQIYTPLQHGACDDVLQGLSKSKLTEGVTEEFMVDATVLYRFAKILKASVVNYTQIYKQEATIHNDQDGVVVWGFPTSSFPDLL